MFEFKTKVKAWGNSMGVVVPKERARQENLKENQDVKVMIVPAKSVKVKDIFGKMKKWKKPTAGIMKEIDEELDSKFVRD